MLGKQCSVLRTVDFLFEQWSQWLGLLFVSFLFDEWKNYTHDLNRVAHNAISHPGVPLNIDHIKTPGKEEKQAKESAIWTSIIQRLCITKPWQSTKTKASV